VSLYATMLGVEFTSLHCHIECEWDITGSVFMQTRLTHVIGVRTDLAMQSSAPPELVSAVVRNAKNGCFAEQALKHPVDMTENVVLNGERFDWESFPATRVRRARD
jgi:hypothetical protein